MTAATLIPTWVEGRLRPVDKLQAHRAGLRHKAVSVFLCAGGATLLQRRAMTKYHTPGLWANACCTHPHWGETALDCARRRLFEELGVLGVNPRPVGRVEYRADVGGGMIEHEVVDIFVADVARSLPLAPDPSEVMDTHWIAFAELEGEIAARPANFTPWLRIYLARHRDLVQAPASPIARAG